MLPASDQTLEHMKSDMGIECNCMMRKVRQNCEVRNGNETYLTTTLMRSRHRSKLKAVLVILELLDWLGSLGLAFDEA